MPKAFVEDYIHWYNHCTEEVVFRPRDEPWNLSGVDQWYLQRRGKSWRLRKGSQTLMYIRSEDTLKIISLFTAVEDVPHIHVSYDTTSQMVNIRLPRLKLDFHINNGENLVHSRQYRGTVLDEDQRIGTLIGLSSKLVLRRSGTASDRLVLIPEGALTYRKTVSHHVAVSVSRQENTTVHTYQLDRTLGRVLDSGAMQSKLLLCLLHALTSHGLPDPLTRHTGTEAALIILRSSAVHSFSALLLDNVMLLNKIAVLSPSRTFYPRHERVMQQIAWDPELPFGSQHGDFHVLVSEIFRHEKKMSLFHSKDVFQDLNRRDTAWQSAIDPDLQERANIRSSTFFVAEFGAEHFHLRSETAYKARDRQADSDRGQRAFLAASMLARDKASLDQSISPFKVYQDHFYKKDNVRGFVSAQGPPSLGYDSKWLNSPSPLVREFWCTIHHHLVTKSHIGDKFNILSWLSTMAYASKVDMDVVRVFVAFYRMPELVSLQIPSKPLYSLSKGSNFETSEVQYAARARVRSYDDSSEAQLPKDESETEDQHLKRIESLWEDQKDTAVENFVAAVQKQWPCERPNTPSINQVDKYLNASSAMYQVTALFQPWYDNRGFEHYMEAISGAVQHLPSTPIARPRFDASIPPKKLELAPETRYCSVNMVFALTAPDVSCDVTNADDTSQLSVPQCPALDSLPYVPRTQTKVDDRLGNFCETLSGSATSTCEKRYVDDLRTSCHSLQRREDDVVTQVFLVDPHTQDKIRQYHSACEDYFKTFCSKLGSVLTIGPTRSDVIASCAQLFPRLSPSFWLSQLKRDRYESLTKSWQDAMIAFALSITNLHRAQRLVALLDKPIELNEELRHVGHTNWNPRDYSETLLLEAESGILVREVQAAIAAEMIAPPGAHNTVMQLNMGEGKSSTIVPIVAAALADQKK